MIYQNIKPVIYTRKPEFETSVQMKCYQEAINKELAAIAAAKVRWDASQAAKALNQAQQAAEAREREQTLRGESRSSRRTGKVTCEPRFNFRSRLVALEQRKLQDPYCHSVWPAVQPMVRSGPHPPGHASSIALASRSLPPSRKLTVLQSTSRNSKRTTRFAPKPPGSPQQNSVPLVTTNHPKISLYRNQNQLQGGRKYAEGEQRKTPEPRTGKMFKPHNAYKHASLETWSKLKPDVHPASFYAGDMVVVNTPWPSLKFHETSR